MSYEGNRDDPGLKKGFEKTLRRVLSFKSASKLNNIEHETSPRDKEQQQSKAHSPLATSTPRQISATLEPQQEKPCPVRRGTESLVRNKEMSHSRDNSGNMNGQEISARGRAHTLAVGENLEKNNESGDHVRGVDRTASFLLRTYYPGKNEDGTSSEVPVEGSKFESLQDMLQKKLQEEVPATQKEDEDSGEDSKRDKSQKPKKKKGNGRKKGMKLANSRNISPTVREDVSVLEPPPPKSSGGEGGNPPISPREPVTRQRSWSSATGGSDSPDERENLGLYKARYSFKGQRTGDLAFEQGDVIRILKKNSSWWDGECNGRTGIFPSNYVEGPLSGPGATDEISSSWSESQLDEEEADGDLLYDEVEEDVGIPTGRMVKILVSGPTEKLIGVMAGRLIPEDHYIEAFLLTRRYFISSRRLYESLIKIYHKVPGPSATAEELEEHKKWQKTIQGRVLNVFQKWAENNFYDFYEEPQLFESLVRFVAEVCPTNPYSAKLIKALRKKKQQTRLNFSDTTEQELERLMDSVARGTRGEELTSTSGITPRTQEPSPSPEESKKDSPSSATITCTQTSMTNAPAPIRTSKDKIPFFPGRRASERKHQRVRSVTDREKELAPKIQFIDITPKELAQQLTIIEQSLFLAISPLELLFGSWKKKERNSLAPHIVELIDWFNKINSWVASEIVLQVDVKKRRTYLSRFIQAAEECRKLGNYNAVKEIISALNRSCINRLTWTWKGLPKQDLETFEKLSILMDNTKSGYTNFRDYRLEFKAKCVDPPCLPYIGVHLQDLLAVEETPTRLTGTNHVNFKKMRNIERAVRAIMTCQQQPYDLQSRQAVQRFLTVEILALSEAELFDASRSCEPQLKGGSKEK